MAQTRPRRDPAARRQAIVSAAAELITEVGVDAVTHRMIAARAAVPLGATTQYFDTLDDLRAAALAQLAEEIETRTAELGAIIEAEGATPAVLTRLIVQGLGDAEAVQADRTVVTAAVHDPRVRELARLWSAALTEFLRPRHGALRAKAAAVFIDGLLWSALIDESAPSQALIETGLTAILTPTDSPLRPRE
ncbi:TetR/AcrR family transcriptional regulator [Microbacterium sp. 22242]|uniref:TetR/AcrR family transcriptional regulator n=1 Tax=Microbacterium sp. 22242 TaxID=3453896 RepID=UPI003F841F7A